MRERGRPQLRMIRPRACYRGGTLSGASSVADWRSERARCARCDTAESNSSVATGLLRYAVKPAASARILSSLRAYAV